MVAFLCRQTDLLSPLPRPGVWINVKKGQFLAPWDMANVVGKVASTRRSERTLDRAGRLLRLQHPRLRYARLPILGPHRHAGGDRRDPSVQQPGGKGASSGGEREFVRDGPRRGGDRRWRGLHRDPRGSLTRPPPTAPIWSARAWRPAFARCRSSINSLKMTDKLFDKTASYPHTRQS